MVQDLPAAGREDMKMCLKSRGAGDRVRKGGKIKEGEQVTWENL